jgi:hypothetical protein
MDMTEGQRQVILIALSHLAVERPGWEYMIREISSMMDSLSNLNNGLSFYALRKESLPLQKRSLSPNSQRRIKVR